MTSTLAIMHSPKSAKLRRLGTLDRRIDGIHLRLIELRYRQGEEARSFEQELERERVALMGERDTIETSLMDYPTPDRVETR